MTTARRGGIAIAEKIALSYRRNSKVQVMLVGALLPPSAPMATPTWSLVSSGIRLHPRAHDKT